MAADESQIQEPVREVDRLTDVAGSPAESD
ncbi:hypothetical protein J2S40_002494 [Nocardioides luteus]|nr:hypothetical protein [Nocardioides luteus]